MKRTHLPLNALRVLDAAARHLSFTRAADELAVTPAAVGQQIRALEDLLGVVLFRRTAKGLELTEEAAAGLEPLREGFLQFEAAVQAMQVGQSAHVYTIAMPREFFAAWAAPRLASYRAGHPGARVVLVDGDASDFAQANLDLAVRLAEGPGELEGVALGPALRVTVGAGEWIGWPGDPHPAGDGAGDGGGEDGQGPLLHVGDAGEAMAAVAAGMGRARVPLLLAEGWRELGRIASFGEPEPARRAYWLVAPLPQWRQKKVQALVAHLTAGGV